MMRLSGRSFILGLFLLVGAALSACAPSGNPIGLPSLDDDAESAKVKTGDTKTVTVKSGSGSGAKRDVPYTIAGQQQIFDKLRTDLSGSNDLLLARSIQHVTIVLKNEKGELALQKPNQAEIQIRFKNIYAGTPEKLNFIAPLSFGATVLQSLNVPQQGTAQANTFYKLDLTCHDINCHVMDLRLKKFLLDSSTSSESFLSQVGILYRTSYPNVRLQKQKKKDKYDSAALQSLEQAMQGKTATRTSVAVVDGPSYSKIELPDVLSVETDLLDTGDTTIDVSKVEMFKPQADAGKISGELVGNDPATGSLILDLNQSDTQESARLIIEDKNELTESTPPAATTGPLLTVPADKTTARGVFTVPRDHQKFPESSRVTQIFDEYAKDPETQRLIRVWLGQEKHKGCRVADYGPDDLERFLTYMPNVAPYLDKISQKLDVTPEIGYILIIESSYAKNPNYPAAQVGPGQKTTALGPWQINDGTASDIRKWSPFDFRTYKVVGRTPDLRDDRTYFVNSSLMAATLLKRHFNDFDDPAMAIFAYHGGGGSARSAINKTGKFEKFDITLRDVMKYRVQTAANCRYINYAYSFLAARAIGQNPHYFGVHDVKPATSNTNFKKRLKNPGSRLPEGIL